MLSSVGPRPQWEPGDVRGTRTVPVAPDWHLAGVVIGLAGTAVLPPVALGVLAALNAAPRGRLIAVITIALLVLAPAGAGIAAARLGLARVVARARRSGSDAEQAIMRVFVALLLFVHALILAAGASPDGAPADCLPVAAAGLIGAWAVLLFLILWPVPLASRRHGMAAFDVLLISTFLHFGGSQAAGWYPLYVVAIVYAGSRFGRGALTTTAAFGTLGFAVVVLTTGFWRRQPALSAGLVLALAVLPALLTGVIRRNGGVRAAATETDALASAIEAFDLRVLIVNILVPLQSKAAGNGPKLRWRIDPRLPERLSGHARAFERIVRDLVEYPFETAGAAIVRVAIDGVAIDARRLRLDLRVDRVGLSDDPASAPDGVPLALGLVQRLAATAGGKLVINHLPGQRVQFAVTLPLTIEPNAAPLALDLGRRAVLIVTEDDELARDLAEPLAMWNGDPRWPDDIDAALAEWAETDPARRAVVLIDGRGRLLSALGIARQAARLGVAAPFVLLIAEEAQIASVAAFDEGELDGYIPAPPSEPLLAKALLALPLPPPVPRASLEPPQPPSLPQPMAIVGAAAPLAPEPQLPETASPLDAHAVAVLCSLGDGVFLGEIIETFRIDARQIMQRIEVAADDGDVASFAGGLAALDRAAGPLGGVQLCALTESLQQVTDSELLQHGASYVEHLAAEIERLIAALAAFEPLRS